MCKCPELKGIDGKEYDDHGLEPNLTFVDLDWDSEAAITSAQAELGHIVNMLELQVAYSKEVLGHFEKFKQHLGEEDLWVEIRKIMTLNTLKATRAQAAMGTGWDLDLIKHYGMIRNIDRLQEMIVAGYELIKIEVEYSSGIFQNIIGPAHLMEAKVASAKRRVIAETKIPGAVHMLAPDPE